MLAPGATRRLTLRFRTDVPRRFGSFGEYDDQLTLIGGWYPYLAALEANGQWALDAPPALADFDVTLSAASGLRDGAQRPLCRRPARRSCTPWCRRCTTSRSSRRRACVRAETSVDGTRIVLLQRPQRLTMRLSTRAERRPRSCCDALRDVVALRPAAVPPPPAELVVVEAPLRLNLTAPGEGDVVVSDRVLKVPGVLRPFHELQLAQAVYAELLRPTLAAREPAADYSWVSEGVSHVLADRFMERARARARAASTTGSSCSTSSPSSTASRARRRSRSSTPSSTRAGRPTRCTPRSWTFNHDGPPGHVVLGKLREQLGTPAFDALLDRCLQTPAPLRACVAEQSGDPDVAARLDAVDRAVSGDRLPGRRHRLQSARGRAVPQHRDRAPRQLAAVPRAGHGALRTLGGGRRRTCAGRAAATSRSSPPTTSSRVYQAVIDPDRKLIDDDRANNAWPPTPQVVLDSADVEVSSTEFGFSALVVGARALRLPQGPRGRRLLHQPRHRLHRRRPPALGRADRRHALPQQSLRLLHLRSARRELQETSSTPRASARQRPPRRLRPALRLHQRVLVR